MKQYHICRVFDERHRFVSDELMYHLNLGRKTFLIHLPRDLALDEILLAADFFLRYDVSLCIHDLTFLHATNDINIGRNLQRIFMLIQKGVKVESLSYHFGSLYGFGREISELSVDEHIRLRLAPENDAERFLCAAYDRSLYKDGIDTLFEYMFNISQFAYQHKIQLLIKNLALDYIYITQKYTDKFSELGYTAEEGAGKKGELGLIPKIIEKGEFPRSAKEMILIADTFDVNIALDLEHLLFQTILSRKYNVENKEFMKKWDIKLTKEEEKMLVKYGFTVKIGTPIIYERPLDFVDEIIALKKYIHIAHLAGSVGPVFLDKPDLTREMLTDDALLGTLGKADIPFARRGKSQLPIYEGIVDTLYHPPGPDGESAISYTKLFHNQKALDVWKDMFIETFTTQMVTLKEVGVTRVVTKMKDYNENATSMFQLFNFLMKKYIEEDKPSAAKAPIQRKKTKR
ncbi:MAG: hypothetical protein HZC28_19850 [Spirochaetes bacterium]|nr:hypothetical protein [Spirochaetota bacterium]